MRVPELNWPADLYTNMIPPAPERIVMSAQAFVARPDLRREMRASWVGGRAFPAGGWHISSPDVRPSDARAPDIRQDNA